MRAQAGRLSWLAVLLLLRGLSSLQWGSQDEQSTQRRPLECLVRGSV